MALQKARYEQGEKKLGYAGLCKLLTEWRNSTDTQWLAEAPVHPLQQALKDLEQAYSDFFAKRANCPRPTFQEERPVRQLPLSRSKSKTEQARPNQQPSVPAQARLDTPPHQPRGIGCGEERHREPIVWQNEGEMKLAALAPRGT
ncbi:MAG: hypothetical protein Q6K35_06070 [Thermostichus sp. DG02_4_bins_136]